MPNILTETPPLNYHEVAPSTNADEFTNVLSSRRSVRLFDSTPVPQDIVNKCLELALLAPTSSNLQCWEFYWVKTPDIKQKLVEACLNQTAARTAQELIVCVARTKTWKANAKQMLQRLDSLGPNAPQAAKDYYARLVPFVYGQGFFGIFGLIKKVLIFFVGFFRPVPREPTCAAGMRTWAVKTSALACENLMLSFRAYGFDTCPMEGFDSKRVKKLISAPRDAIITMVVAIGKRTQGGIYGPRIRFDRSQFIKEI